MSQVKLQKKEVPDFSSLVPVVEAAISLRGTRLLVKPHEYNDVKKTESGLIVELPKDVEEIEPTEGTIVCVSEQIEQEAKPWEKVKSGDVIIHSKYAGYDVEVNGDTYKCLNLSDVIGVLNSPNKAIKE